MTRTIGQRELRNASGEIMRALDRGEEFVMTRNGVPVGELRPVQRPFVSRAVLLEAFRTSPSSRRRRFRADLDAVVDQRPDPHA